MIDDDLTRKKMPKFIGLGCDPTQPGGMDGMDRMDGMEETLDGWNFWQTGTPREDGALSRRLRELEEMEAAEEVEASTQRTQPVDEMLELDQLMEQYEELPPSQSQPGGRVEMWAQVDNAAGWNLGAAPEIQHTDIVSKDYICLKCFFRYVCFFIFCVLCRI